jgi:hypothetical protein
VFAIGQANGDSVLDFAGNGAAAGDTLMFAGYGPNALFFQLNATQWMVMSQTFGIQEVITFAAGTTIAAADFLFV